MKTTVAAALFQELELVLKNRKIRPSVFQVFKACSTFASKHRHVEILRCFDRLLLSGKLWQTLESSGHKVNVVASTRKNKYEASASTTYNVESRSFTITLRLPRATDVRPSTTHVGGMTCTRETCLTALLAHEFVHVLEIILRQMLRVYVGFSKVDKENVVFTEWLRILFAQRHDRNVI